MSLQNSSNKKWKLKLGIILISVSVVIFLMLFSLPFVHMDTRWKIGLSTLFAISGEVLFWLGIFFVGKDVYKKFILHIKSGEWMEKKKTDDNEKSEDSRLK